MPPICNKCVQASVYPSSFLKIVRAIPSEVSYELLGEFALETNLNVLLRIAIALNASEQEVVKFSMM